MSPNSKANESQPPTPCSRSGRLLKTTEKAKDHFATQAKNRKAREEKVTHQRVAAEIESQAGPERDDGILLGELEPFQAPNPTGNPAADRKLFIQQRTAWLVRALLIHSGRDVRNDITSGEIGLKELEAYWADLSNPAPPAQTQSGKTTTTPNESAKRKIILGATIQTLKTTTTSTTKRAPGMSVSQASANSASTSKMAGNKRGPTDSPLPASAPNKLRRTESTATTPPRPRPSFALPSTPEQIPAPLRKTNSYLSSSQAVHPAPATRTPTASQSQPGAPSTIRSHATASHTRDEGRDNRRPQADEYEQLGDTGGDEGVEQTIGRESGLNGERGDERDDEQDDEQDDEGDDEQGDKHDNGRRKTGHGNGGRGREGSGANRGNGNGRDDEESGAEQEDVDDEPVVEPPPVDVQDPNKPRLRSFRPLEHRRLVKVVADKVLARLIADGTYLDVLRARQNRHGDRITSLEQYAAEEWNAECQRRNLRRYRLRTIHIKYIRGRVTSWRARVKERVVLELRSTHKLGVQKKQTKKHVQTILPHAFHSSANSNKHALFTGDILPELIRIAIYVHARDIGPLNDDLFNPAPIGLIAFMCTIANHVFRLFETGRYRARSLRVPEQASTFRMYHSRLLQMQEKQPTRLANVRHKIYNACISSLSIPIAAPASPPLSDREWTPDSEHEFVQRADESGDDSGDEEGMD